MEYDILRLDVPVDDAEGVYLIDGLADLPHDEGDPGFGEGL